MELPTTVGCDVNAFELSGTRAQDDTELELVELPQDMAKEDVVPNPQNDLEPLTEQLHLLPQSTQIEQTQCTEHSTLPANQEITAIELSEEDPLILQLVKNIEEGWQVQKTKMKKMPSELKNLLPSSSSLEDAPLFLLILQTPSSQLAIKDTLFDKEREFTKSLSLTDIPDEKKIWEALNSIDSTKVAGPDGFTADFYKKVWLIVKGEVIATVQSFFWGADLPKYFSTSTITLVPKDKTLHKWENFRPISLTSIISKIISKVLVHRLQPQKITPTQPAFIKDRSIVDNVLLAQELLLDLDRIARGGNLIFKFDIKKAYDTISWKFIE
ncbi:uncharacterized protein LOC110033080 [Phalaenopsis equestris]|uniref:uncharacterized protein LOC110033080 n=1 Tax=Phalaenopsis equestris TaxID=78828 RepID=UPI0009E5CCCE|nr:uncharacterized protein LOC110033080 [Phalaenopsis equestris]